MDKTEFNQLNPALQVVELMTVIYLKGLTTASGGNISIRTTSGDIFITPALIDKGDLKEDNICCILKNGDIIGENLPSSELNFHKEIYEVSPVINCIIHAHPPSLVACSIRNYIPDDSILFSPDTRSNISGYAKYAIPGSKNLATNISQLFKNGKDSVVMENHGAVVGGKNPLETLMRFEYFEYLAQLNILTNNNSNSENTKEKYWKNEFDFHLTNVYHKQYNRTTKIGENLCKYLTRLYNKNYLFNCNGTISSRENNTHYLINSSDNPYWKSTSNELLNIKITDRENKNNLSYNSIHNSIYYNNPEINSIIIAQPPYLMTYAINGNTPEIKTIPEAWIFLKSTIFISFEDFINDKYPINNLVKKHNLIIIGNLAIVATGANILEAFNRIEVAEFNAKSVYSEIHQNKINILNKDQINNLNNKYFNV